MIQEQPSAERPMAAVGQPEGISLADVVAFFRRNALVIIGAAVLAGAAVAAVVLLFVPRQYEASATLAVVPARYASELKPSTLTVKGYQTLLESDAVIAQTKQRLVEKGIVRAKDRDTLELGETLETRIFVSRRAEEINLAPMIQAVARGETADQAAAIANTWAQVFLDRVGELMGGTTSSTVKFIEGQYPRARDRLADLEHERTARADAYQKRYDEATTAWDAKVLTLKNETSDLVAAYQAESRRLAEQYQSQRGLDTRTLQLKALRKAFSDLQDEQARVSAALEQKQLQVEALRHQLAETPQFLTLRKAITDDALWRQLSEDKPGRADWKTLQARTLQTQEVNPVYTTIASNLSQAESDFNALKPRASQLEQRLQEMSAELKLADSGISADNAGLEKLQREREAGLANLQNDRANALAGLNRDRQRDLDAIRREWDTNLAIMDRDIAQQRELFGELAKKANQALLAKAEPNAEDVRLAAPAMAPDRPRRRGGAAKTAIGIFAGALLGIGLSLVREAGRRPL
jgi:uncharacterized protein involved in exopolysaccharide biosynthesis